MWAPFAAALVVEPVVRRRVSDIEAAAQQDAAVKAEEAGVIPYVCQCLTLPGVRF